MPLMSKGYWSPAGTDAEADPAELAPSRGKIQNFE